MSELRTMQIGGKEATVAFMTAFDGEVVAPEEASVAIATFDDGGVAYYLLERQARDLGGPGSGNWGHSGTPGQGGSPPKGGGGGGEGGGGTEGLLKEWKNPGGFRSTGIKWQQKVDQKTGRPIPIKVKSVEEGAELVLQGKVVEFDSPEQAYTLIDVLGRRALAAKEAGQEAKDFDLCGVTVKGTSLFCAESLRTKAFPDGIPRIEMPQLGGKPRPGSEAANLKPNPWNKDEVDGGPAFKAFLGGLGMQTSDEVVPAAGLRASQREMKGLNVGGMMRDASRPKDDPKHFDPAKNPIFISSDNYVIDGHHRWATVVGLESRTGKLGKAKMNVVRINAPISEVLHIASVWSTAFGIEQTAGVVKQTKATGLKKSGS